MVRPDEARVVGLASRCVELAGERPATVIADEPCSRPRASGEIPPFERGVESPPGAEWLLGWGAKPRAQCASVNPAAPRDKKPKGER